MDTLEEYNPSNDLDDQKWARTLFVPVSAILSSTDRVTRRLGENLCYLLYHASSDKKAGSIREDGLKSFGRKIVSSPDMTRGVVDQLRLQNGYDGFGEDYWTLAMHPAVYIDGRPCSDEDWIGRNTFVLAVDPRKVNVFNDALRGHTDDFQTTVQRFYESGKPHPMYTFVKSNCASGQHLSRFGQICPRASLDDDPSDFYDPKSYVATSRIHPNDWVPHSEIQPSMKRAELETVGASEV